MMQYTLKSPKEFRASLLNKDIKTAVIYHLHATTFIYQFTARVGKDRDKIKFSALTAPSPQTPVADPSPSRLL